MIQINLLPPEYRRAYRLSPKTMGLLFVASVLAFGGRSSPRSRRSKLRGTGEDSPSQEVFRSLLSGLPEVRFRLTVRADDGIAQSIQERR